MHALDVVGDVGLAAEWHPTKNGKLTPFNVSVKGAEKFWWAGSCGHEWQAVVAGRSTYGSGCLRCRWT